MLLYCTVELYRKPWIRDIIADIPTYEIVNSAIFESWFVLYYTFTLKVDDEGAPPPTTFESARYITATELILDSEREEGNDGWRIRNKVKCA